LMPDFRIDRNAVRRAMAAGPTSHGRRVRYFPSILAAIFPTTSRSRPLKPW
jgi:hypothetical protein